MAILTVKLPCTIPIITRSTPFPPLVIMSHGGCYQILPIGHTRLLGDSSWSIFYWIL